MSQWMLSLLFWHTHPKYLLGQESYTSRAWHGLDPSPLGLHWSHWMVPRLANLHACDCTLADKRPDLLLTSGTAAASAPAPAAGVPMRLSAPPAIHQQA